MEHLSQIIIPRQQGDASIQLIHGDLTAIPRELEVDILAVSAFRGSYWPNEGTLMAALFNAGLSVAELAEDKEINLLEPLSCWLSKPLIKTQQEQFNFKKILCFEPKGNIESAETEVANLFRGINTFAFSDSHNVIAMPVLATGNRQFPLEVMLSTLLDTAIFWLENGLPLASLKLFLHREDQVQKGLPIFENAKQQYEVKQLAEDGKLLTNIAIKEINVLKKDMQDGTSLPKMDFSLQELSKNKNHQITRGLELDALPSVAEPTGYDYFISYSHRHSAAVQELVDALKAHNPQYRIFYDRDSIPPGGLWIKMISDAIQNSRNVICILTPEYGQSTVCWDEFQCAYIMEQRKKSTIRTINFYNDDNLPLIMAIRSYIDCREGDVNKLKQAIEQLVAN